MGKYFSMYKWAKRKLGINPRAENKEPKTTSEEQPPKPKTLPDDVWKIILNILLAEPNVTKDVLNTFLNLEIPDEIDIYYDLKINKKLKLLELKRMSVIQPLSTLERTMTREQLYKQGNPRWAHDISAQAIGRVREAREKLDEVYLGGRVVDATVKCSFAEHGYYPELLIHDENFRVRMSVIQYSSDYCARYARHLLDDELNSEMYWGIFNLCMRCPELDEETLTKLLEKQNGDKPYVQGLSSFYVNGFDAKYAGYRHKLTALDKTMTRYQLYQIGSPAWVNHISVDTICNVQHAESVLQNMVHINKVPFELFNELAIEPKNAMDFSRCVEHVDNYVKTLKIHGEM